MFLIKNFNFIYIMNFNPIFLSIIENASKKSLSINSKLTNPTYLFSDIIKVLINENQDSGTESSGQPGIENNPIINNETGISTNLLSAIINTNQLEPSVETGKPGAKTHQEINPQGEMINTKVEPTKNSDSENTLQGKNISLISQNDLTEFLSELFQKVDNSNIESNPVKQKNLGNDLKKNNDDKSLSKSKILPEDQVANILQHLQNNDTVNIIINLGNKSLKLKLSKLNNENKSEELQGVKIVEYTGSAEDKINKGETGDVLIKKINPGINPADDAPAIHSDITNQTNSLKKAAEKVTTKGNSSVAKDFEEPFTDPQQKIIKNEKTGNTGNKKVSGKNIDQEKVTETLNKINENKKDLKVSFDKQVNKLTNKIINEEIPSAEFKVNAELVSNNLNEHENVANNSKANKNLSIKIELIGEGNKVQLNPKPEIEGAKIKDTGKELKSITPENQPDQNNNNKEADNQILSADNFKKNLTSNNVLREVVDTIKKFIPLKKTVVNENVSKIKNSGSVENKNNVKQSPSNTSNTYTAPVKNKKSADLKLLKQTDFLKNVFKLENNNETGSIQNPGIDFKNSSFDNKNNEKSGANDVHKINEAKPNDNFNLLKHNTEAQIDFSKKEFINNLAAEKSGVKKNGNVTQVIRNVQDTVKQILQSNSIKLLSQKNDQGNSVELKLSPDNLGKVKISVEVNDNVVKANFQVENNAVKNIIRNNFEQLKQSIVNQGLSINSINVSLSNSGQRQAKNLQYKKKYSVEEKDFEIIQADSPVTPRKLGYNTYEFLI